MSDEYLNNEEETSALFVSAQKKKRAEEEAARKAAEEQAKREAAEAEVRRMEAEVEERKRKAEEERKALEEQERQLAEDKMNAAKEVKPAPVEKKAPGKESSTKVSGSKSKLPIYIGIGAAAVLALVLILVFALKGKGGSVKAIDPETTEFNAEYVSKEEGFDVKISYPDSVYKEVTEEKTGDDEVTIHFGGADVIIATYTEGDRTVTRTNAFPITAGMVQRGLQDSVTEKVKKLIPDVKVVNENGVDVTADDAGKYEYNCTFESAESGNGAVAAWIRPNSKGEYKHVIVCAKAPGANADDCAKVCAAFEDKNCEDAIAVPGAKPPVATDTDGLLEIDEIHMGLVVPKDVFKQYDQDGLDYLAFTDENGAAIICQPIDVGGDILSTMSIDPTIKDLFKKWVDRGINSYYKQVDSRMVLDEDFVAEETALYYSANCKDQVGGISYWERFRAGYWFDERQQKEYFYVLITMAPEKNEDVYRPIFDTMLDRLKDL